MSRMLMCSGDACVVMKEKGPDRMSVPKAVGIETEYGIFVWGAPEFNPFRSSQLMLNAYQMIGGPSIPMGLYYNVQTGSVAAKQPETSEMAADSTVEQALRDAVDAADAATDLLEEEIVELDEVGTTSTTTVLYGLGSLMLANGARYYIDHAHPEYCTPETLSPRLAVAADKAGERIIARCMEVVNTNGMLPQGQRVAIYKNNSDQKGNSYGCHENYLLSVALFEDLLKLRSHLIFRYLLPFLVTRIVFTGAGKVGYENHTDPATFQLSQRADFFEMLIGLQTTYRRPLFNTRDEAHTDSSTFRRLHVILGDANMAEFATYLKVGTTQLLLHMIEDGFLKKDITLKDPLAAFKHVSRDLTFRAPLELENGQTMTAVEMQETYLNLAEKYLEERGGTDEQWEVWQAWADVIDTLQSDNRQALARKLDWAIKLQVLDRYIASQGTTWEDVTLWQPVIEKAVKVGAPRLATALVEGSGLSAADYEKQREVYFTLRRLDLEYHDVHFEGANTGLFYRLQNGGHVDRLLNEEEVETRIQEPPPDTRAWLRGKVVEKFSSHIIGADWSFLRLRYAGANANTIYQLELPNPLVGTQQDLAGVWDTLSTPEEMFTHFRTG